MPTYLTREAATAEIRQHGVPIGKGGLKDHASRGTGPRYQIINGRALYTREDLLAWIAEQAAQPPRAARDIHAA